MFWFAHTLQALHTHMAKKSHLALPHPHDLIKNYPPKIPSDNAQNNGPVACRHTFFPSPRSVGLQKQSHRSAFNFQPIAQQMHQLVGLSLRLEKVNSRFSDSDVANHDPLHSQARALSHPLSCTHPPQNPSDPSTSLNIIAIDNLHRW